MPEHNRDNILIVGAGLGAFRLVEQLRRRGYAGKIRVIGSEPHLPYDRPPLSKHVLRGELPALQFPGIEELDVQWTLHTRAVKLDPAAASVVTQDGRRYEYDHLVLAPGGRPRMLPQIEAGQGIHVLRTKDDANTLKEVIAAGRRLVVVGAGFIGCEIAASARQMGVEVDIVDPLPEPLIRVLGSNGAAKVRAVLQQNGVRMHMGASLAQIRRTDDGDLRAGILADGTEVVCDDIVIGIGIDPEIEWLAGSGLELGNGIVCSDDGRTNIGNVFALGDAAQWWHHLAGEHRRIEHWTTTSDQASVVAANLVSTEQEQPQRLTAAPYFWSDQFNVKIQGVGFIDPTCDVTELSIKGRPILLYSRAGVIQGVVGFSIPGAVMRTKALIERMAAVDEAVEILSG